MSSIHPTVRLAKGITVTGLWHKRRYQVERLLGEGARGSTYLVKASNKRLAMKVSRDPTVISAEANILKKLQQAQGVSLGPSLVDVDDGYMNREKHSFYVMEYVQGKPMTSLVSRMQVMDYGKLMSQLLADLHVLHKRGYVFGDLKLDNMIFDSAWKRIRLVDVGGVTPIGRGIREYTSVYDRGYWRMGSRKADVAYDLFALGVCFAKVDSSLTMQRQGDHRSLPRLIARSKRLKPFHSVIHKAVSGQYRDALAMKRDIDRVVLPARQSTSVSSRFQSQSYVNVDKRDVMTLGSMVAINAWFVYWLM
ncbi:serine/threonine-protein kinase [Alkalibacillus flavidus]|uniref:Serine/threonine-protein kinase n=1 Tax=Alkalibacillus flavidus TaxID=546021 RepID=A0ABV2KXA2_9BACI